MTSLACRQIKDIAELYNATDINQYLVPIVLQLLEDKVAEVRRMSVKAVSGFVVVSICYVCHVRPFLAKQSGANAYGPVTCNN